MYSRGAPALAREIQRQGVNTSVEQCQQTIDNVATSYPVAWKWIKDNQESAVKNEYVATAFGRRRYFTGVSHLGDMEKAAAQREAANSPIQGLVADLLAQAGINLYRLKYRMPEGAALDFKVLLPIHDAFLFEVRRDQVTVFKDIVKLCMSTLNKIPGTSHSLDGYRARIRNHGHSCFLCEIVIRSQFHTTYEPEA